MIDFPEKFWIHEDASDVDEFGAATPKEALLLWIINGLGTDEYDNFDLYPHESISHMADRKHTILLCRWQEVKDSHHLHSLIENSDPLDDEGIENMKVGDSFHTSIGMKKLNARISIEIDEETK